MFEITEEKAMSGAKIRVVGIGGGGCNAVNTMIKSGLSGVEYIVANTDAQALAASLAPTKIQLGAEITKGFGAGANPEIGRKSALEEYEKLSEVLEGSDMVFITAGMGGGTGTGGAPVVAKLAKEMGALTVGVVTKPFIFEGKKRSRQANEGIKILEESVDSLITIPNQRLLGIAGQTLSLVDTFKKADEVLLNAVQGISDLISNTGLINSDFADVSTIMSNKGLALMGTGVAEGDERAIKAATLAISSPLLEDITIDGATGIIINITGSTNLASHEVTEAATLIMEAADEDAEIIFGTVIDDDMGEAVKITVIATGLHNPNKPAERPVESISSTPIISRPIVNEERPGSTDNRREEVRFEARPQRVERVERVEREERAPLTYENSQQENSPRQSSSVENIVPENRSTKEEVQETREAREPIHREELSSRRSKSLAERLGFINFDEDEFDKPSYLRKDEKDSPRSEI